MKGKKTKKPETSSGLLWDTHENSRCVRRDQTSELSEILDALKKLSLGDTSVRLDETTEPPVIAELKHMINVTSAYISEIVDQSHEFAICLAEHFDVMHRVSRGDLSARILGTSNIELIEVLKSITNSMIEHISTEMNERQIAEDNLRQLEAMESSILSAIPHAVVGLTNRLIVFANKAVETVFGWKPDELTGMSTRVLYRSDDEYEKIGRIFYPILEKQQTHSEEFFCRHKDGRDIICKVSASVIGSRMKDKSIVVMYEDISSHKYFQAALLRRDNILLATSFVAERFLKSSNWDRDIREVLEQLGKAADASRVYIFRNHADSDGRILSSQKYEWVAPGITPQIDNPDLQDISLISYGFSDWEEKLGSGQLVYGHVSDFPEVQRDFLKEEDILSILVVPIFSGDQWWGFIGFDDCVFARDWSLPEIETLKSVAGILGAAIHRSKSEEEKIKLEMQLIHAQKMEAIGQLAGGIAHDFNNILTGIIGYGHFLKMKMKDDDPLRTYSDQILTAAEKAANLTQSLLAFSRKQIINPIPVMINEIVESVRKFLSRIIGEDIELIIRLTDTSLTVMADPGQIEQVLMNLVANARDAMPEGGQLVIETKQVMLDNKFVSTYGYGKPGKYALVSITDTGAGMDESTRARIFEPFFTTKEVGKGTGLGLAMAYGIIKQHDGYVNVTSEKGKGTKFRIYLPVIRSKASAAHAKTEKIAPHGGSEIILIAEDNLEVRSLTKSILEDSGYTVIAAVDGDEAIEKFRENMNRIRLVILDVIMPKKNGKEALDIIQKIKPDIRVLFTSGYSADIIHKKGILDKSNHFLSKPVLPNVLLRKIREILDS